MAQFTNQATLSYGTTVTSSNVAVGEVLEVLSITKTAVNDTYGQNDTITYIISLINTGAVAINGLTVTDNLGTYPFGAGICGNTGFDSTEIVVFQFLTFGRFCAE